MFKHFGKKNMAVMGVFVPNAMHSMVNLRIQAVHYEMLARSAPCNVCTDVAEHCYQSTPEQTHLTILRITESERSVG